MGHELHVDKPPKNKMDFIEFWDMADRHHVHDKQRRLAHYHCSNNHNFTVTYLSRCPVMDCTWNAQPEINGVGLPEAG